MPNVATTIEMAPIYRPYERPSDPSALWSVIPRGLRGFVSDLEVLDAKPLNDTQTLLLTATLPASFAYVFAEISLRLEQDRAVDWIGNYSMNFEHWYQGLVGLSTTFVFGFALNPFGGERSPGGPDMGPPGVGVPKAPMWGPAGSVGIQIEIRARNIAATASSAGIISAYINFWEFDLEQARKFPINTPLPVHSR